MVQYRTFRNTDPPALVEVWNESFTGRGAARLRHGNLLERHAFAKPYFDPKGVVVAEENGVPIGFGHAGFGPNQRESGISKTNGVTLLVAVREAYRRRGVGSEILERCEAYLKEQGAQVLFAGPQRPYHPFYFGVYGGSDLPGLLVSDAAAGPFLEYHGYRGLDTCLVFQRQLDQPLHVPDARFANLRRRFDIRIVPKIPLGTWFQECALGIIEPVEFRMEEHVSGRLAARAVAWEMECFSSTWNLPAVGILDIQVREDVRRQGFGKFILTSIVRYLQEQYFGVAEVQCMENNQAAVNLFKTVGFEKVDAGRLYRKR